MDLKWFAASVMASKNMPGGFTTQSKPIIFQAASEEIANGYCLLTSKKEWFPESDGWYSHQVSVIEFPFSCGSCKTGTNKGKK